MVVPESPARLVTRAVAGLVVISILVVVHVKVVAAAIGIVMPFSTI
jgi:hypothetical protein